LRESRPEQKAGPGKPLYQVKNREAAARVDSSLKALIVHAFLEEVEAYAEKMIAQKQAALSGKIGAGSENAGEELRRKLRQWQDYRDFNRVALEEIEGGTLDAWFERLLK